AMAYSFKYSRRPGTPAATMTDQIDEAVLNERLQRLQALLNEQQQAFNARLVGRTARLLLERKGKLDGQLIGKSPWLQSVHVIAPGLKIGDMVDVRVVSAGPNSLGAEALMEEVA
ncbi:MAG: TRAM domain-containing protein, partial [Sphingopyxis sp.]|nr:TRAM domain-containing protein [Sphingopyxis sp.]